MGRSHNVSDSRQLFRLADQFTAWRAQRSAGTRIPDRLWKAAARAALCFGVNRTAKTLVIDYYSLRKRVTEIGESSGSMRESNSLPAFVELPASPLAVAAQLSECVIEFEKPGGAKLRVQLKGAQVPDLLALGSAFWRAE